MKNEPFEKDIQKYLQYFRGEECDLLRFPGNYGDALIWHSTQVVLRNAGLSFQTIEHDTQPVFKILIVDGGGNLVDYYSDVKNFLETYGRWYSKVIILPHTIVGAESLACLSQLGNRLTVFCRECVSYTVVNYSLPEAEVYLWHDCAFYAQIPPSLPSHNIELGELRAFRTDIESTSHQIPKDNRDLSLEGYAMSSLDHMFDVLRGYKRVFTDRLHIAIAGALLGCEVELYPNSYYKNRAVYEYSLRRHSNVRFAIKSIPRSLLKSTPTNYLNKTEKDAMLSHQDTQINRFWLKESKRMKVECSFGEVVDKVTILRLKEQNITDETTLLHLRTEIAALKAAWSAVGLPNMETLENWVDLKEVNRRLWAVENDLRECEHFKNFGNHFVQLARQVYRLNDRRTKLKRAVNEKFGSRLVEHKTYTQYDDARLSELGPS